MEIEPRLNGYNSTAECVLEVATRLLRSPHRENRTLLRVTVFGKSDLVYDLKGLKIGSIERLKLTWEE